MNLWTREVTGRNNTGPSNCRVKDKKNYPKCFHRPEHVDTDHNLSQVFYPISHVTENSGTSGVQGFFTDRPEHIQTEPDRRHVSCTRQHVFLYVQKKL